MIFILNDFLFSLPDGSRGEVFEAFRFVEFPSWNRTLDTPLPPTTPKSIPHPHPDLHPPNLTLINIKAGEQCWGFFWISWDRDSSWLEEQK
jgi:hypothetical protein